MAKQPGFSLPAVVTLALGLGASAAIFTLVHAVLVRPLPYPESTRLVAVRHTAPGLGLDEAGQSEGTYLHYRTHARAFEEIGIYLDRELSITDERDAPERILAALVTPSVFRVLRVAPLRGRAFTEADVASDSALSVVISHDLWVRRYGADPGIVGQSIELNRRRRQVVGIMPPGFAFPRPETKVWYAWPVRASASGVGLHDMYYTGIARLRAGATADAAERDLRRLVRSLPDVYADATPRVLAESRLEPVVVPLKDTVVADVRPALVLLLCASAFLLLIVWANVANLFLVRAERLRKEVAVERALGATGGDLARRFLTESLVVCGAGAAVGLVIAVVVVASRFGFEPGQVPRLEDVRIGPATAAVLAVAAALSGLLLGGVSFVRARTPDLPTALKGTAAHTTAGRPSQSAQRTLVAVQVALALALLVGSATMAQSFWRLKRVDLGFRPNDLVTLELPLPAGPYPTYERSARFFVELLERVRAVPGIAAAEAVGGLPLVRVPAYMVEPLLVEGAADARTQTPTTATLATAGYFRAMGIPLLAGRTFRAGDIAADSPAVVVSASLARTLFGKADPLGRRVRFARLGRYPWHTIVGVAGDVPGESIAAGPGPVLYLPVLDDLAGRPDAASRVPYHPSEMTVVVRTTLSVTAVVASVRRVVRGLDPKVPVANVRTMDRLVAASMARARLTMLLLVTAAATALLLGVVGIYGVVSYAVSRRTREFGVRMALGARPTDVNRMVVRQGTLVAVLGVAGGLLLTLGLTRFLTGLLYEVRPNDPATVGASAVLLLLVAALASYLPARRAGRTDPVTALKAE
jgi:predicted permease